MIENSPDSPILSLGAIDGSGPESYEWRMAIRVLGRRVDQLRVAVSSPLRVNVIYFIPGPTIQIEFEGVRTGSYSRSRQCLIVQAALPELPELSHAEVVRALLISSIDAAESFAKRRKIAENLNQLHDLVGMLYRPCQDLGAP
jgi:hypothetical protein